MVILWYYYGNIMVLLWYYERNHIGKSSYFQSFVSLAKTWLPLFMSNNKSN